MHIYVQRGDTSWEDEDAGDDKNEVEVDGSQPQRQCHQGAHRRAGIISRPEYPPPRRPFFFFLLSPLLHHVRRGRASNSNASRIARYTVYTDRQYNGILTILLTHCPTLIS